jgi:hypothetical protein
MGHESNARPTQGPRWTGRKALAACLLALMTTSACGLSARYSPSAVERVKVYVDRDGRELLPLTLPVDERDLLKVNLIAVCLDGYGDDALRAQLDCGA